MQARARAGLLDLCSARPLPERSAGARAQGTAATSSQVSPFWAVAVKTNVVQTHCSASNRPSSLLYVLQLARGVLWQQAHFLNHEKSSNAVTCMMACSAAEGSTSKAQSERLHSARKLPRMEAAKAAELVSQTGKGVDMFSLCHWSF